MVIAMSALVIAGDLAQVSRGARFGDGTFADTGHSGGVVAEVFQCRVAHTLQLSLHVDLAKKASMLQVAVGHVTVRVVNADQGILNVLREGMAPIVALAVGIEEDPAHASFGSVSGTQQGRLLGYQLGQVSGARAEAGSEATEGVEAAADEGVDADAVVACLVLSPLQGTEETGGARDGDRHEAQFAQEAAPLFGAHAPQGEQFSEDVVQSLLAVRRQLQGLAHGVDNPPEDELTGAPAAVARQKFLQGHGFVTFAAFHGLRQDLVDAVQQVSSQGPETSCPSLTNLDEVVNEHVSEAHRQLVRHVGGGC